MVEKRSRPTIMDGEVVTFATGFDDREGVFGPKGDAVGPFEVSSSRNAVMVHRCTLRDRETYEEFAAALDAAWFEHERLRERG